MSVKNGFETTHWSMVLSAGHNADTASRKALETLCEKYWPALYGYVRRHGHSLEDAHDLTQEFFLRLLERNWIARADQTKGRFRSFMLTLLKRFLADEWDKSRTLKRGGKVRLESLSRMAEAASCLETVRTGSPELEFERDWAVAMLKSVLEGLETAYVRGGKARLFATMRNYLVGGKTEGTYAVAAAELGMSEAAFKVAVCRVRRRYRERIRQEVASTVADSGDIEAELRHLYRILAKSH